MEKNILDSIEEIKKEIETKFDNYSNKEKIQDDVPTDLINIEEKTSIYYSDRKPFQRVIGTIKL